jgi:aldose 1-epimerase
MDVTLKVMPIFLTKEVFMRSIDKSTVILFVSVVALSLLSFSIETEAAMTIEKEAFGNTPDGKPVDLYTLKNDNGIEIKITNYEGIVVSVFAPDHAGNFEDIVLGYDTLEEYIKYDPYFGGITDRKTRRFDNVVWSAREFNSKEEVGIELSCMSQTSEEPISVTAIYTLNNSNELKITYTATTDKETTMSLTNNIYFNLAGAGTGDILDHELLIHGKSFYPLRTDTLTPLNELRGVMGTPMDYRQPAAIRPRLAQEDEQVRLGGGYQHIWRLDESDESLPLAARMYEPTTKRVLEVRTTASGMWFETGNFMDGTIIGKGKKVYERHYGVTLAAHAFSPTPASSADFPSIVIKPGETYTHTTVYKFFAL